MGESNDYSPGAWGGYDYTSAKSAYDTTAGRGYGSTSAPLSSYTSPVSSFSSSPGGDVVQRSIASSARRPLVVALDMTGSMDRWRDVIGQKLAYLDKETPSYLGDDTEICLCAIGDAPARDTEPLQVRPFAKGTELVEHVSALRQTGGGGDSAESYELAALYLSRNAHFATDARPVLIFIGDEGLHDRVEAGHASWAHIDTQGRDVMTRDIMEELKKKYSVYIVRKPYPQAESKTQKQWVQYLGDDHVFILQAPERILDVIFGVLAIETGMEDYFQKEIEGRQSPEQVSTVYTSLRTKHVSADVGKSTMLLSGDSKKTKHLLGGK